MKIDGKEYQTSTLKLDGNEYHLAYDFNLIAKAEELVGCNLLDAITNLDGMGAAQLRGLLFAAIVSPRLTLEQVGNLIRLDTVVAVTEALLAAYLQTVPEEWQKTAMAAAQPEKLSAKKKA